MCFKNHSDKNDRSIDRASVKGHIGPGNITSVEKLFDF